MALNFDNKIPEWKNEGIEPTTELKEKGFTGGYKPPATVFNWFWCLVQKCITELQTKLKSHVDNTSNPHGVTKAQVGLSNVDNTSDLNKPVSSATQKALNSITSDIDYIKNDLISDLDGQLADEVESRKNTDNVLQQNIDKKSDLGHIHSIWDLRVDVKLECVYTRVVHAEDTAPDENSHHVAFEIDVSMSAEQFIKCVKNNGSIDIEGNQYTASDFLVKALTTETGSYENGAEWGIPTICTYNGIIKFISFHTLHEDEFAGISIGDTNSYSFSMEPFKNTIFV